MITSGARAGAWTRWAVGLAALGLSMGVAEAASTAKGAARPALTRSAATAPAVQDAPEVTSSIGPAASEERPCDRSRKRLWVEGEGWVVRKVTTCY